MSARDSGRTVPDSFPGRVEQARAGSASALGELLESCRHHLLAVATRELDAGLRPKAAPSDVVQQTFLEAQNDFRRFRGRTEAEWLAWLNSILHHNLANLRRRYRAGIRRWTRERPLSLSEGSGVGQDFPAAASSPSGEAILREEEQLCGSLFERFEPYFRQLPDESRAVIEWVFRDRLTFPDVAGRLGCSVKTARRRLAAAVEQLRQALGGPLP